MVSDDARVKIDFSETQIEAGVYRLEGVEQLSQPYQFRLELVTEDDQPSLNAMIGEAVTISILDDAGNIVRYIHGAIAETSQEGYSGIYFRFAILVVPPVWMLSMRRQSRIFQGQNAQVILEEVFNQANIKDQIDINLQAKLLDREYCVQYRETDFDFVHRLMEEEGMYYYFQHTEDKSKMVIVDHMSNHVYSEIETILEFTDDAGMVPQTYSIKKLTEFNRLIHSKFKINDYNYLKPALDLSQTSEVSGELHGATVKGFQGADWIDYPGKFQDARFGETKAKFMAELELIRRNNILVHGDFQFATPGIIFDLQDHPVDELNQTFLVTHSSISVSQPQVLSEHAAGATEFHMDMQCIPSSIQYRTPMNTQRPVVLGVQTAVVAGPSGEEIYTDEFGRIKVSFPWDLSDSKDELRSCWIRVSQAWSGAGWGSFFLPRIGSEVLVDFLDGDPDRPLVTGQVYHGVNKPPYELPADKTRSCIRTNSSVGGGGYNEIRFEDKKDEEGLHFRAQKDLTTEVLNDSIMGVANDQHCDVGNDRVENIAANMNLSVGQNQNMSVGDTVSLSVGGSHQMEVADDQAVDAGGEIHLKAGTKIVLDAGSEITITAGGSFIKIAADGVTIKGAMINLNSGGSAGSGKGVTLEKPKEPLTLDAGKDVKALKRPEKPVAYSPAAMVLKQAAVEGTPFCEECEKAGGA